MSTPEVMTTREVAEYLRVSERSVNRWRRMQVGPPYTRVGHQVRYLRPQVDEYLLKHQHQPLREN